MKQCFSDHFPLPLQTIISLIHHKYLSPVAGKTDPFEVAILQDSFSRHTKTKEICFFNAVAELGPIQQAIHIFTTVIINRPVEWLPTLIQSIMTYYVQCNESRLES